MKRPAWTFLRRQASRLRRSLMAALPAALRSGLYRRALDFTPTPKGALELKIADTQAELEACFALLHNAYVASGFMRPHPSGLRVTPYHALPTTTTLCAKVDGKVVGTLSIVRDGVFGFPMQTAFDISGVRAKEGRIAEISALAVHPQFRKTGGSVLFPLMKFMYEYCTRYFDTRHLLIAVNPGHIEMYESLLCFSRLTAQVVDRYDFANGAPAVGATLDLHEAPAMFERLYAGKPGHRNLHHYFVKVSLPEIRFPERPWHTSNDPVLTPALMKHFFSQRTQVLESLDERQKQLLHSIYPGSAWAEVLPPPTLNAVAHPAIRRHPRFSFQCPATLRADEDQAAPAEPLPAVIVEISARGFRARSPRPLTIGACYLVSAELGDGACARVHAQVVRCDVGQAGQFFGFHIDAPDDVWRRCAAWLENSSQAPRGLEQVDPKALASACMKNMRSRPVVLS